MAGEPEQCIEFAASSSSTFPLKFVAEVVRLALILLAFGAMSVVITVIQETRTERVLEALRDLTSPRALVIRGSERRRIAGRV